jgi:hypothetical protein
VNQTILICLHSARKEMILRTEKGVLLFRNLFFILLVGLRMGSAQEAGTLPAARVDGLEADWRSLGEKDFRQINCTLDTWTWKDGYVSCTGLPIGVLASRQTYKNFELVAQWRHLRAAGNSGIFVWVPEQALQDLKPDALPQYGIEIQALDHGFSEQYEKKTGKKGDWFTTNGDVFAVGNSKMSPFAPTSPNGSRSFPRKKLGKGAGEWNHYYVRAINGEVRLWVNGEEVSGGNGCEPSMGSLCLESEGSPVEFKDIRIRELP